MTRDEFDQTRSWGEHDCPDCGTRKTHPTPGCGCPPSPTGYGTLHINKWHHTCPIKPAPPVGIPFPSLFGGTR